MADKSKKDGRPKMILYQYPGYRSFRCLWIMHELGIADDVELVKLNSLVKDTEEYKEFVRTVNPHGTIPALVIEGEGVMLESTGICLYLADMYGKLGPPDDRKKDFYDWTIYGGNTIDQIMEELFISTYISKDEETLNKMLAKWDICMERVKQALQDKQYICGESLTVPDCVLGYVLWETFKEGLIKKDYPEVRAYIDRLENRPAFKAAVKAQDDYAHSEGGKTVGCTLYTRLYPIEPGSEIMADKSKTDGRPKMILYQYPEYRSFSCLWIMHELGIADDVELVKVNSHKKGSEEYKEFVRSVHPHGTIPALVIEGEGVMLESTGICLYLADMYGKLGPPADRKKDFYDWTVYSGFTIDQIMEVLFFSKDDETLRKMRAKWDICMERVKQALQDKQYLCGDSLTVPDCVLGYILWVTFKEGLVKKDYPEVTAYIDRLVNRPAFKATVKAQE